jgi:4-carboxymuconolactone decarboxylase
VAAHLNVGNDPQALISVVTVILPFIGYPRPLNALAAINEVARLLLASGGRSVSLSR